MKAYVVVVIVVGVVGVVVVVGVVLVVVAVAVVVVLHQGGHAEVLRRVWGNNGPALPAPPYETNCWRSETPSGQRSGLLSFFRCRIACMPSSNFGPSSGTLPVASTKETMVARRSEDEQRKAEQLHNENLQREQRVEQNREVEEMLKNARRDGVWASPPRRRRRRRQHGGEPLLKDRHDGRRRRQRGGGQAYP